MTVMTRRIEIVLLGAALAGWWEGSGVVVWFGIVGILVTEITRVVG
jgi:hypothetical protein